MSGKVIIGLECHVQLDTDSKMFCGCRTQAEEPNSQTCEICLGMPGSKPRVNEKAISYSLKLALALNCKIADEFFFSRKTYFYPDMAKNFQISQYEIPLAENGFVQLKSGKKIRITRVHMEEDPAALVHEGGMFSGASTLVDYNRSGIPLVEVVTEPDIASPKEAREFLDELVKILTYLGVFEVGKNTLKVDSNVSLSGGERVEVKNIGSVKFVEKALDYEIERQGKKLKEREKIIRETRSFDEATHTTKSTRIKETEEDYGFIFEPDLTSFKISKEKVDEIKASIPELHSEKGKRFVKEFGLDAYTAEVLASEFDLGNLFEEVAKKADAKLAAKFLSRELLAILNRDNLTLKELNLDKGEIVNLLKLLQEGSVTEKTAKEAMINYVHKKVKPTDFIKKNKLLIEFSKKDIEKIIEKVLKDNKQAVEDYKAGEAKALNFLVGLVMREAKGKAEPRVVQKMVEEGLK